MKLYLPGNDARCSQVLETSQPLAADGAAEKIHQFVHGCPAPKLDEPLKVRIHCRSSRPLPLPDIFRGSYLMFVSARGKAVIEKHFNGLAEFLPVEVVGLGVEKGSHWTPADLADSPFAVIPGYHVMHVPGTADIIDLDASTIVRESIGELPDQLPVGLFHQVAFNPDVEAPPLFALPFHTNMLVVSEAFVTVAREEKLAGFRPTELFDTSTGFLSDYELPPGDAPLVSLREALEMAAG